MKSRRELPTQPLGSGAWSSREIAELARLRDAFPPPYENENGLSEEGDPWWVVSEAFSNRVLVHVARIGRRYSVICAEEQVLESTIDLKAAIDLAIMATTVQR